MGKRKNKNNGSNLMYGMNNNYKNKKKNKKNNKKMNNGFFYNNNDMIFFNTSNCYIDTINNSNKKILICKSQTNNKMEKILNNISRGRKL